MNLVEELRWRGMIHDIMPGTEELLNKEKVKAYIGFDPTADSLHIGSLVQIMLLVHLQRAGHTPIALVGGATGMVGDPSGKSEERNLLDAETVVHNAAAIKGQLSHFLDFENGTNKAIMVNNYDWFGKMFLLDFIRDVGKHLSINYMMAKDSVQKRLQSGMSFTEFSYQLVQGYDFYHLYKNHNCKLQMGGSDQWGNMVTGTELIRRMAGGEAFAITSPLVTKADGGKFGKTETGNVWLDPKRTSPYHFYQFWLNTSDEDAETFIKIFTLFDKASIEELIARHYSSPHERLLQKKLAEDVCTRVHGAEEYQLAVKASEILFGKATFKTLSALPEATLLSVFEGVPQKKISKNQIATGVDIITFVTDICGFLPSKGEARRALKESSLSLNKQKVTEDTRVDLNNIIAAKYMVLQRGKKRYFLVVTE